MVGKASMRMFKRRPAPLKPMCARDAKTVAQVGRLDRDNFCVENGWLLLNPSTGTVTIARQMAGEAGAELVDLPRKDFNKLVDWYNRPQPVKRLAKKGAV